MPRRPPQEFCVFNRSKYSILAWGSVITVDERRKVVCQRRMAD